MSETQQFHASLRHLLRQHRRAKDLRYQGSLLFLPLILAACAQTPFTPEQLPPAAAGDVTTVTYSPEDQKGFTLGYRIGYFDGDQRLVYLPQFPPLDADKDGLYDNYETLVGLDAKDPTDAKLDRDADFLSELDEFLLNTAPTQADTDADGIPDGVEVAFNLNPRNPADAATDTDQDGVSNLDEYLANTDMTDASSAPLLTTPGLTGQYFTGKNFDQFVLVRVDSQLDFNWGSGAPAAGLPKDKFSVRWIARFKPTHASGLHTYRFSSTSDDGVRLWVNGDLVIDQWRDQSTKTFSALVNLAAETPASIRMEYYENGYGAVAKLVIADADTAQPVPASSINSPLISASQAFDTDADGIPDYWELKYGLNPWVNDAAMIFNSQAVSNLDAFRKNLHPWTLEPITTPAPAPTTDTSVTPVLPKVSLAWSLPLTRVDGSALAPGEIDHFTILFGPASDQTDQQVTVAGASTSYDFYDLPAGTWYFKIIAVDTAGLQSAPSAPVSALVK